LLTKQNRSSQFKTQKERDSWIKSEIKDLTYSLDEQRKQKEKLEEDLRSANEKMTRLEGSIENMVTQSNERKTALDVINEKLTEAKMKRDDLTDQRK
jgi:structural maintenance of chromosome 3 (chondroitin sulfate proteoglycan 6)